MYKLRPEARLPGRDPAELLFRSLATTGRHSGTHADWIWLAVEAIERIATGGGSITVDDLRHYLERRGVPEPTDARAYGTAFREAARLGYIENSGEVVMGEKRTNVGTPRARPIAVWRSLL